MLFIGNTTQLEQFHGLDQLNHITKIKWLHCKVGGSWNRPTCNNSCLDSWSNLEVLHCIVLRNLKLNSTPFWIESLTSIYSEVYEFLPVHHAKMTEGIWFLYSFPSWRSFLDSFYFLLDILKTHHGADVLHFLFGRELPFIITSCWGSWYADFLDVGRIVCMCIWIHWSIFIRICVGVCNSYRNSTVQAGIYLIQYCNFAQFTKLKK